MHVSSNPHQTAMKGNLASFPRKTEGKDEKSEVSESYLSAFVISTAVIQHCAVRSTDRLKMASKGRGGALSCASRSMQAFSSLLMIYIHDVLEIPQSTNSNTHLRFNI